MSSVLVVYGCSGELRPRSQKTEPTVTEIKRVYEVVKPKAPPPPAPVASVVKAEPKPSVLEHGMRMSVATRRELRALAFFTKPERIATRAPEPRPVPTKPEPKPPEPVAMRDHEDTDELPLPEPRRPAAKAQPIEIAKVEAPARKPAQKPAPEPVPVPAREPDPEPKPVAVAVAVPVAVAPPPPPSPPPPAPVAPPPPPPPPAPVFEPPSPDPAPARKVEHRPKRPTPMSPQQATHHLMLAWEKVTGEEATLEVISVFWAQWALETGRGRWMVDYNYAGLKGAAPDGGWAYWWTWEEAAGGPHRVRARFRNYETADRGAEDYVGMLWRMYPKAVAAAKQGNAAKFIDELVDGGFFTEIPRHYRRSVVSLAAEFRRDTRALRL